MRVRQLDVGRGAKDGGSVLLMAVLTLAVVMLLGLSLLENSEAMTDQTDRSLSRLRASALAEGAIELMYEELARDPGFRGTTPVVSDSLGLRTVTVTSAGSNEIEILAVASVHGVPVSWRSRAVGSPVNAIADTIIADGGLTLRQGSHVTWSGTAKSSGSVALLQGSTGTGSSVTSTASLPLSLVKSDFSATADRTHPGNTTLGPGGTATGKTYVAGQVTIVAPFTVLGTLYADGPVTIQGTGGETVTLDNPDGGAVLVGRNTWFESLGRLDITGAVIANGTVNFDAITNVQVTGSVIATGAVTFRSIPTATVDYDSRIVDAFLPGVNGLTAIGNFVEQWRRPGQ